MRKNYNPGITEKRLNNRRFRRTEEAILRTFFEEDVFIGAKDMAKKAGVARSTFYHHHRTVREIVPDYKRYIMRKYNRLVRSLCGEKKMTIRRIYSETLIFLIRNKRVFELLLRAGEIRVVKEMMMLHKSGVVNYMRINCNIDKIFGIYLSEIIEIIGNWGEKGFPEMEIRMVLDDMMFLTDTAKKRLSRLS